MKRISVPAWILPLSLIFFLPLSCRKETRLEKISGFAQGSYYAVSYYTDNRKLSAGNLQPAVDSVLADFDLCASLWNDSSEICRANRNEDFKPSRMFCDIFNKAQSVSELTGGVFDITVSPLVKRYGFSKSQDSMQTGRTLSDEELIEILAYVGWEKVRIENGKIEKDHPLLQLDFNAIAQGYSAELVAGLLEKKGISSYLVDVGGEICSKGTKPDGRSWVVGIEKPAENADSERSVMERMELKDQALVTSGNYRKYFEEEGKRYPHTIDPRTGKSARNNLLSATILCRECWKADALATACMVWGTDSAKAFLSQYPEKYQGFLIYADSIPGSDSTRIATWHTQGFPVIR